MPSASELLETHGSYSLFFLYFLGMFSLDRLSVLLIYLHACYILRILTFSLISRFILDLLLCFFVPWFLLFIELLERICMRQQLPLLKK